MFWKWLFIAQQAAYLSRFDNTFGCTVCVKYSIFFSISALYTMLLPNETCMSSGRTVVIVEDFVVRSVLALIGHADQEGDNEDRDVHPE